MEPRMKFQDLIFMGEIVLQSKIAERAAERLEANHTTGDHVEIWCSIQSILVAAGNVSKILSPNRKYAARGKRLRQMLGVQDDSPLLNRDFRNHFEHYDERVESWFENRTGGSYIDPSMNPHLNSGLFGEGFDRGDHRGYNAFNNTLVFRGEILDLNMVLGALEDVRNNCRPYTLDFK